MNPDKETIRQLTNKVRDLEVKLEQQNEMLGQYMEVEKKADEKIKALNTINADKIRSLMNSIQLLKKENASLKKGSQEHKRSELINNLNKEIADQDLVIETLRRVIGDEQRADGAIMDALNKGPPRHRTLTREELMMEMRKLKTQLAKYSKSPPSNADGAENANNTSKANADEEAVKSQKAEESMMASGTHAAPMPSGMDALIAKNMELQGQIEDLNLNLKIEEHKITVFEDLVRKKNQEIITLNTAKAEYQILQRKYETVQAELDKLREEYNKKYLLEYEKEMRLEELNVINKTNQGKLQETETAAKLEIQTLQLKIEELEAKYGDAKVQADYLKSSLDLAHKHTQKIAEESKKKIEMLLKDLKEMTKTAEEKGGQIIALTRDVESFGADNAKQKAKIDELEKKRKEQDLLNAELKKTLDQMQDASDAKIAELEERLQKEMSKPAPNARPSSARRQPSLNESNASIRSSNASIVSNKSTGGTAEANLEINRLRAKVAELTGREIELLDRIEMLEAQLKAVGQKNAAANLLKRGDGSMLDDDVRKKVREASERYEKKIMEMNKRIIELETRCNELEAIDRIAESIMLTSQVSIGGSKKNFDEVSITESYRSQDLEGIQ